MDELREAFCAFMDKYFDYATDFRRSPNGDYRDGQTHDMWMSWQAAIKWKDKQVSQNKE